MIELLAIACSLIQQQDKAELLVHEATGLHAESLTTKQHGSCKLSMTVIIDSNAVLQGPSELAHTSCIGILLPVQAVAALPEEPLQRSEGCVPPGSG